MGLMSKLVSKMSLDSNQEEYYEEYDENEVSEGCQEVSEEAEKVSEYPDFLSEAYPEVSERRSKVSGKPTTIDYRIPKQTEWQHRSLSKAALARKFDPFSVIVTVSIGAIAVVATIYQVEFRILIMMYALTIILALVTNPLHAIEKILALPSRWMMAISLLMIDLAITIPSKSMILAAGIVATILMTATIIGNNGWLIEETYLATEFTRKAQDFDIEDLPHLSWRAHGKRETWTAIEQAGLIVTEYDINLGYRIAYRVGHFHGMTAVEANNKSKKRLEGRIEELEDFIEENHADFESVEQLKRSNLILQGDIDQLKIDLKNARDEAESNEVLAEDWEKKASEYKNMITELNKKIKDISEAGISKDGLEDMIVRMLKAGISYRKIEEVTGQNKFVIGEIKKKHNIESTLKQEA